jgi:Fic family protein
MKTASKKEKILSYARKRGRVVPAELLDVLGIGRAMVHRHLKALVDAGLLRKIGSAPKAWYVPTEAPPVSVADRGTPYEALGGSVEEKVALLGRKRKANRNPLAAILAYPDIRDQFLLSLTYHSNRIEGSTLSEHETAAVLFQNAALPDKSLTEQLEAKNHQAALTFLFEHLRRKKPVDEALVLALHGILMNAIRPDAGAYRRHAVRIVGSHVPTSNFLKVPDHMRELMEGVRRPSANVPEQMAATHVRFEQIHPFSDGNGRVGRLLMAAMLLRSGLPPAVIRQEEKRRYMERLNKAQLSGETGPFVEFTVDAILEGYRILEREG